jgi:dolichyl-phosphate-mannose-protein mannosyltransferase
MGLKPYLRRAARREHLWLLLLVVVTFGLHLGAITRPDTQVADEAFYVADARSIIAHQGTLVPQQPPLGKLFIVDGIRLFGDDPFGWRFFSVVAGALCIILFYLVCQRLKLPKAAVMLAVGLFSLENLSFVQASVAMLDVYALMFMLLAAWLFLRGNLWPAGAAVALGALVKLPAVAVLGVIFLYWLLTEPRRWRLFAVPALTAAGVFLAGLVLFNYTLVSQFADPLRLTGDMLKFAGGITFSNGYTVAASPPWAWLAGGGVIFYNEAPQYLAALSPTVGFFIIPAAVYLAVKAAARDRAALFGALWFACLYLPWIAAVLVFDRLTYLYYLYPAVPAVCLGLGLGLTGLWGRYREHRETLGGKAAAAAVGGFVALHVAFFIALLPVVPALVTWLAL